ncbi:ATP-grasp domain-containing protein [Occallatibacter savannae]|uniref:carboxylate--amine ligase n=1 Tax=Occallatibacter savannae TaxID=1002691 RepID=UPI000D692FB1|nr:ATP-grasp domain-containing protein [Occallatibacter savannae]
MATIPQEPRAIESRAAAGSQKIGALVVGGDHPGLAIARSLGRRGIPVYIIDDQYCISSFSKYAAKVIRVESILDERKTVDAVLEVGRRYNLRDWVLFPTRDENVAAFSRYRDELTPFFRVTTGDWKSVEWAWDKKKTYELAEKLGIPCPMTFNPMSLDEIPALFPRLPLAVKPAVKENFFYATGAKAWRANTPEELQSLYEKAIAQIRPEEILIQEIVPGDGTTQYSYCAFVRNGRPVSVLTARRARQHPREFGRAATYVETIDAPEIEDLSERFLKAIEFHGLVEIEYKRDPRSGEYKLLDVNARPWGFHAIGSAAGVDFPYMIYADQMGLPVEPSRGRAGVGWLRMVSDIPTAISDMFHGSLGISTYVKSLRATRVESVFNAGDPLPSLAELVMLPYLAAKKYLKFQK